MNEERAEIVRRDAAKDDEILNVHLAASDRARKAWRTRKAIERGERPPMRTARARCVVVDGPFAGKTLLLERELVYGDEWAIPGATYRFAESAEGRIAYLANTDPFTPMVGWRGWHFAHEEMGKTARRMLPLLRSGTGNNTWPGGAPLGATCDITRVVGFEDEQERAHVSEAPDFDCSCGIYSTLTHHQLGAAGHAQDDVVGLLAGWGRIVEHSEGFRFARAYPQLLIVTERGFYADPRSRLRKQFVEQLRQAYRVPVASAPAARVPELVAEYVASAHSALPTWVYRALPPDLRAAGIEHEKKAKENTVGEH